MRNHDYCCIKKKDESSKCDCTRSYPVKVWDCVENLGELDDNYIYDFKRSIVVHLLRELNEESREYDEGYDEIDYESMTNEALESHFCLSGFVEDGYMHEVIDD